MKRLLLVAAAVALFTSLFAGVALTKTFVCDSDPCNGTKQRDQIGEQNGSVDDEIFAKGGNDDVNADRASNDRDRVLGEAGADRLNAADRDTRDSVSGGKGNNDTCIIDIQESEEEFAVDGINNCEEIILFDESGGPPNNARTEEQLRPATPEEIEAAEAAYDGP